MPLLNPRFATKKQGSNPGERYYRKTSALITKEVKRTIGLVADKRIESIKKAINRHRIFQIKLGNKLQRNFISYVLRSAPILGNSSIKNQLKDRKKIIHKKIDDVIRKLLKPTII